MSDLTFSLNQKIFIEGKVYWVTGFIKFMSNKDGNIWTEYKLKKGDSGKIFWLSIDEVFKEYAMYTEEKYDSNIFSDSSIAEKGYKEVDRFGAKVVGCKGNVDVDIGERVEGTEYEDSSEELIISIEQWGDEIEYSKGYYVDSTDIRADETTGDSNNNSTSYINKSYSYGSGNRKSFFNGGKFITIIVAAIIIISTLSPILSTLLNKKKIANYVKGNSSYTYETSITSTYDEDEKAKVYKSSLTLDGTVKDIIDGIDGDTQDVSQNDDDNSIAILTDNEYCLVYESESEDETESGEVLVQVSTRLYSYTSNSDPYRSGTRTRRFYRGYYYSKAYTSDSSEYSSHTSSYAGEDTSSYDTTTNSSSTYNSYSSSVRQSSASSRNSSGGGSSHGK